MSLFDARFVKYKIGTQQSTEIFLFPLKLFCDVNNHFFVINYNVVST